MKVGKQVLKRRILETKRPMIICVKEENKEENYDRTISFSITI